MNARDRFAALVAPVVAGECRIESELSDEARVRMRGAAERHAARVLKSRHFAEFNELYKAHLVRLGYTPGRRGPKPGGVNV